MHTRACLKSQIFEKKTCKGRRFFLFSSPNNHADVWILDYQALRGNQLLRKFLKLCLARVFQHCTNGIGSLHSELFSTYQIPYDCNTRGNIVGWCHDGTDLLDRFVRNRTVYLKTKTS